MKQAACESARLSVSSGRASTKRRGNAARKTGVVLFGNCVPANSNLRRASRRIKTPARRVLRPQKRSAAAHPQSAAETQRAKRARPPWQLRPGKYQSPPRFPPHQNAGAARFASAKAVRGRASAKRRGNAARKTGAAPWQLRPGKFQSPPRFSPCKNAGAARFASAKAVRGRASTKRRGNAARKTGVVLFGNCAPANSNPRRASRRIKTPARHVLRPQKRSAAAETESAAETRPAKRARPPWQLRPGKFQSSPRRESLPLMVPSLQTPYPARARFFTSSLSARSADGPTFPRWVG